MIYHTPRKKRPAAQAVGRFVFLMWYLWSFEAGSSYI